jgi:hypothetical protein
MNKNQLLDFVLAEVKNEKIAINLIENYDMSSTEAQELMVEKMKHSYSSGAAWNDNVKKDVGAVIIGSAIFSALLDIHFNI